MKKKLFTVFFLLTIIISSFPLNIRGEVKKIIEIETDKAVTEFTLFDLTGISIKNSPFIEGLELSLTIPDELAKYRDSFMLNIYYKLDSIPSESNKSYKGTLLLSQTVPVSKKIFISIPMIMTSNNDLIPGSLLTKQVNKTEFPIILSVSPVMKGIPSSVLSSIFKLEILPVISTKGILDLNLSGSENKYTIILDGKEILYKKEIILEEGIHQIIINSVNFKEISQSFVISRGNTTKLEIIMEQLLPTVIFEAPEGSEIILDGEKIDSSPSKAFEIKPGDHVVRMKLGDYSLSKKFTVDAEKKYKISLFLDILIQEN
ncbi:MAG: PEGA domain-containing protein [Spirochaetales bacterium]|nr:PEGA domain-containing protein [Spirochaetales bacterium]